MLCVVCCVVSCLILGAGEEVLFFPLIGYEVVSMARGRVGGPVLNIVVVV